MKKLLLIFTLIISLNGKAQTITIPDANLAAWIQHWFQSCINGNQLDTACLKAFGTVNFFIPSNVTNLSGLEYFPLIQHLYIDSNSNLINISNLPNVLDLDIVKCPNLQTISNLPNTLQSFKISNCNNLINISGFPAGLVKIDITNCNMLTNLPALSNSLDNISIKYCSSLPGLPSLPNSLKSLYLFKCINLTNLPAFPNLLKDLNISNCPSLNNLTLPNSVLSLFISNCNNILPFPTLPNSLKYLSIDSCSQLINFPALPNTLDQLTINNCINLTSLSPIISNVLTSMRISDCPLLTNLQTFSGALTILSIGNCNSLTSLPPFPSTLYFLTLYNCLGLQSLPAFTNSLHGVIIGECNGLSQLPTLTSSIKSMWFQANNQITNLPSLPYGLEGLYIISNTSLTSLPTLPNSLKDMMIENCTQIGSVPNQPHSLESIYIKNCNSISSLGTFSNTLKGFSIENCNQISNLPSLPNSINNFYISNCTAISSLQNLPNSLQAMAIRYTNIINLPSLPNTLVYLDCSNNSNLICLPNVPNKLNMQGFKINATSISCLPNYTNFINPSVGVTLGLCQSNNLITNPNNCSSQNIIGLMYSDNNNNCSFDSIDLPLNNLFLRLTNNSNLTNELNSSNYNGDFGFIDVSYGNYTLKIDTIPTFLQSCTANHIVTLNTSNPDTSGLDFGLQCKPNVFDLGVKNVLPLGPVFPGQQHALNVSAGDLSQFFNFNCTASQNISATVTVNISGPVQYIAPVNGASIPTSVVGNTLTYSIPNISFTNLFSSFNSLFVTDTTAQANDSVCVTVTITTPQSGDVDPLNNTYKYCYQVVNSYDPNIKVVNKEIVAPNFNDWLTYTIYFQNTGNAPAYNIKLIDTLDNALDLNTFEVIGYSHQNSFNLNSSTKQLVVNYPNILLPDSFSNPIGSIGYIQYRIKPKFPMALNSQINNRAGIYFDFNAPIITNTVTTTATNSLGLSNTKHKVGDIELQPNPASQSLTVSIGKEKMDYITISELSGKVLIKKNVNLSDNKVYFDLSQIENGLYLVNVHSGGKIVKGKKLVVSK